ncbi:hypothetical protein K501DRAFT_230672 [Backusella circina FSU 941]|nr:hypothetical protein K501DRAFT_230672 [Backusella circina FSU 941]
MRQSTSTVPATFVNVTAKHPMAPPPLYCGSYILNDQKQETRFRVSTPPPSASPVELAPIIDMCDLIDGRPPSPDSPKQKLHFGAHHEQFRSLPFPQPKYNFISPSRSPPPFLEPTPQLDLDSPNLLPSLFKPLQASQISFNNQSPNHKRKKHSDATTTVLQTPTTPRRSSPQIITGKEMSRSIKSTTPPLNYNDNQPIPSENTQCPMSPTMAAASASAAALAAHQHPGSHIAESLLKAVSGSQKHKALNLDDLPSNPNFLEDDEVYTFLTNSDEKERNDTKKTNPIDQSMFLTKNAHIKRPRNAWIHFRCHYGQALKIQDPSLRAEGISKCASRRWARLSENEKKPWHSLAEQEKLAHREAFPEYRYCPRRTNSNGSVAPKRARSVDIKEPIQMYSTSLSDSRIQKKVKRGSK